MPSGLNASPQYTALSELHAGCQTLNVEVGGAVSLKPRLLKEGCAGEELHGPGGSMAVCRRNRDHNIRAQRVGDFGQT